jgi:hypothetical protein
MTLNQYNYICTTQAFINILKGDLQSPVGWGESHLYNRWNGSSIAKWEDSEKEIGMKKIYVLCDGWWCTWQVTRQVI